jgi:hypothetical protein
MKTEDLIFEIVSRAEYFSIRNPHVLKHDIVITVSLENGKRLITHILETYMGISNNINYKSLTIYGYRLILSEMLNDDEIVIGVKENV